MARSSRSLEGPTEDQRPEEGDAHPHHAGRRLTHERDLGEAREDEECDEYDGEEERGGEHLSRAQLDAHVLQE